jgi:hypothetical protein
VSSGEALAAVAASLTSRHKLERHGHALLIVGHDCGGVWVGGVGSVVRWFLIARAWYAELAKGGR